MENLYIDENFPKLLSRNFKNRFRHLRAELFFDEVASQWIGGYYLSESLGHIA